MAYCGYFSWPPMYGDCCLDRETGAVQEEGHAGPCAFLVPAWVAAAYYPGGPCHRARTAETWEAFDAQPSDTWLVMWKDAPRARGGDNA